MADIEERLQVLEQTVKAYRDFLTHIVKLLLERRILTQEELHEAWAGIIGQIRAQEEAEEGQPFQGKGQPGAKANK